jgi:hypothetical protein
MLCSAVLCYVSQAIAMSLETPPTSHLQAQSSAAAGPSDVGPSEDADASDEAAPLLTAGEAAAAAAAVPLIITQHPQVSAAHALRAAQCAHANGCGGGMSNYESVLRGAGVIS